MDIKRKKGIAISVIMICCVSLLICFGLIIPNAGNYTDQGSIISSTDKAEINTDYGYFTHGSTYRYTDYTKVEDAHEGRITDDTDLVTVDSYKDHGSKENPFVINSESKWSAFAADMDDASTGVENYGEGKYFVLSKDLNFSGQAFQAIPHFSGTFYGLGHTISNINCDFSTKEYSGLFMIIDGEDSVVADVIVKDATFTQIRRVSGFICGHSEGAKILNCQANGAISRSTAIGTEVCVGGIIGETAGENDILLYRCSVSYTHNSNIINTSTGSKTGGVIGDNTIKKKLEILDCYARVTATLSSRNGNSYLGFIGASTSQPTGSSIRIEKCVGYSLQNNINQLINNPMVAAILCFWNSKLSNLTIKDSYMRGRATAGGAQFSLYPTNYYNTSSATTDANNIALTISNLNWSADNTLRFGSSDVHKDVLTSRASSSLTRNTSTNENDFWSDAQAYFSASNDPDTKPNNPNNLWTDTSTIGDSAYSVDSAPVRNASYKLNDYQIKFRDLKYDGSNYSDDILGIADATYNYENSFTLPTASIDSNHIFLGWTADKSGESIPDTTLPLTMYGDVTLYAVWDMPASVRSASIKAKDNVSSVEYDTGTVVLEGDVSATCITNPTIKYKWQKTDGTVVSEEKTYTLREVNDSDDFKLNYVIADSEEPLWLHKDVTNIFHAEITPGKLSVRNGTFRVTSHAYIGMQVGDLTFEVTMVERNGNTISGVASWNRSVQVMDRNSISNGKFATKIKFTPSTTYNNNYDSASTYDVEIDVESLKIVYHLDDISDTIECEVDYNQNILATTVVSMFYAEFNTRMTNGVEGYSDLLNLTPYFNSVMISEYDTDIPHINAQEDIIVTFAVANFKVTFDADNGDDEIVKDGYFYNNYILTRDVPPTPTNNGKLFRGWYLQEVNDLGNTVYRKWDFLNDKVTGNIRLVGRWLDIRLLQLMDLQVTAISEVEARQPISDGVLKVTATFEGTVDGEFLHEEVDLAFSDYLSNISYDSGEEMVHYATPGVTVTYTHNGVSKPVHINVLVKKIPVDTSMLTLENKQVVYDGSVQYIEPIQGLLPSSIDHVEYVYRRGGVNVDASNVIASGLYTVTVEFVMNDPDFEAKPMTATLEILPPATEVTLDWDTNTLIYNGKVQHPTAIAKDASGKVINVKIDYVFESVDAINVGNNYKVKAVIDRNTGYEISGDASVVFSIQKAILDTPTLKSAIYYTGEQINLEDGLLDGFNPDLMEIQDGVATNAGDYYAQILLHEPALCGFVVPGALHQDRLYAAERPGPAYRLCEDADRSACGGNQSHRHGHRLGNPRQRSRNPFDVCLLR